MSETTERNEKPVKVRKHPILSHPIAGCILITIYAFLFYQILAIFGSTDIAASLLSVAAAFLLLLIHRLWFRKEYKGAVSFSFMKDRKVLTAIVVFLAVDIILAIEGYLTAGFAGLAVLGLMLALGAGTVEESVFRALPVSVMMRFYKDKENYLPALILPAVIFGAIHMINALGGQNVSFTILQAVSAAASGIFFGALFLRTGSIVSSMFCHVLHDILASMQAGQTTAISTQTVVGTGDIICELVSMVLCFLLAFWLLKGYSDEVHKIWKDIWHTGSENS